MTETNSLHNAINSLYENPLSKEENAEAEWNLMGFFSLTLQQYLKNQRQSLFEVNFNESNDNGKNNGSEYRLRKAQ